MLANANRVCNGLLVLYRKYFENYIEVIDMSNYWILFKIINSDGETFKFINVYNKVVLNEKIFNRVFSLLNGSVPFFVAGDF